MMSSPLLEVKGLKKSFGSTPVLNGVNLSIAPGEHMGLVGNNGEGKTTLLRLVLGLLRPDEGEIRIRGEMAGFPRGKAQKRLCGYLPESVSFYPNLTGQATLRYLARLKGARPGEAEPLLDMVGLREAAHRKVKTYSKGMRQRLGLAQALLGEPVLLLLDEPTNGLDPAGIREFYETLEKLQRRDVAVLTATHLLTEIEAQLDHLALLKNGGFLTHGSIPELIERAGLSVEIQVALKEPVPGVVATLEKLGAEPSPNGRPHTYVVRCSQENKLEILEKLMAARGSIKNLKVYEPGLEAVFHHHQAGESQAGKPPVSPRKE